MNISIATATFYEVPFKETLTIIKKAGFKHIELDIYWKGKDTWEMAQHLKGLKPKEVLNMIKESGLKLSALHDIGGVIYDDNDSLISKTTYEYLEHGLDDIPCIIFHSPHKKTTDNSWWNNYRKRAEKDLKNLNSKAIICLENMPPFNEYKVPLIEPLDMLEFVKENNIFVNIDTTHYAEAGIDIVCAADILKKYTRGVHLSDYKAGKTHLYIGSGNLKFKKFFSNLCLEKLPAITLECNMPYDCNNEKIAIDAMIKGKKYIEDIL